MAVAAVAVVWAVMLAVAGGAAAAPSGGTTASGDDEDEEDGPAGGGATRLEMARSIRLVHRRPRSREIELAASSGAKIFPVIWNA